MPVEILALKLVVTPLLIAAATLVARRWGPGVGGWLAGFLLVLAVFAQRSQGPAACVRVLRGGVMGSFAFAVFFLVVGALLGRFGISATYALAALATIAVNGAILWVGRRVFR
jgi:hypothetical protein